MRKKTRGPVRLTRSMLVWLPLLLGSVLAVIGFTLLTWRDQANVRKVAEETLSLMQARVIRFDNYQANDRTKSLVRLLDKTSELSRCLAEEPADTVQSFLNQYVYDQRLTGVLILDRQGAVTAQAGGKWESETFLKKIEKNENVRDIIQFPKKAYLVQMDWYGNSYDVAAVSQRDRAGVVLSYVRKTELTAGSGEYTIENLFAGDSFNMDGVVVVTDGRTVLDSNQTKLQGKTVAACRAEQYTGNFETDRHGLLRISGNGKTWYGGRAQIRGYQLYAFFPDSEVFATRTAVLGYSLAAYIFLWLAFSLLRYYGEQENIRQIKKQYRVISSISGIYSTCFNIQIPTDQIEIIRAPRALEERLLRRRLRAEETLRWMEEEYIAPDYWAAHRAFTDPYTLRDRLSREKYLTLPYQDCRGRWIQSVLTAQEYDGEGRVVSVLLLSRDITEEKRRELDYQERLRQSAQQAERANVAKTDFLRRMSHDIRTPINGIRGMVDISRHYRGNEEKQEECRRKIQEASGFLLDLVNHVLDMNKLESGEIRLEKKPFDLRDLLNGVVTVLEGQAEEQGVTIRWAEQDITHWWLVGSPLHLQQILQNIVGNAVKYSYKHGAVTLSCQELSCQDGQAAYRFVCADTGRGMSPEFQKHAFEPFAQEDQSAHSKYAGTGLGLPITRELVLQMGGEISFVSQRGRGTTFTILLHFQVDDALAAETEETPSETGSINGVRILLVEDNKMNMEIARFFLESRGATVTAVWNGQEAVDRFAASAPGEFDMIFMDIMMPVMDGLEAARTIRDLPREDAADIPIFAMTANAFSDDAERSIAAGMNGHLTKPLDEKKVIAAVRKYWQHIDG